MMKDTLDNKTDGVEDQVASQAETETCERCCPSEKVVDAIIRKRVYGAMALALCLCRLLTFWASPPFRSS